MAKYKIIPSTRTIAQSPISIGHKAEKGVEAIEFDVTAWVETYGSGTLTVIMRRWGDAIPYPIALEIDENNKATWTLSDIDTAKAGMAYAQLSYVVGDEVVKKSDIYTFRVMDSLTGEGEPPEAYESWLEHLTHLAAEAMAEVLDIEGIVTDKTLTVDGGIADGKATGDALALKADKSTTYTKTEVDQMIEDVEVETDTTLEVSGAAADAAETGRQIGLLKADLVDLQEGGYIADAQQIQIKINAWLAEHPEAITTVQDESLTYEKLVTGTLGFVAPEMYGYTGDNLVNDTSAFKSAIESGFPVYLDGGKTYFIDAIEVNNIDHVYIDGRGASLHAVPHESVVELFKFNSCGNITVKNINVYSEQLYTPDVSSSNHNVPSESKSSNVTFVACVSCDSIKLDNIVAKNMYRFFTTWRVKDEYDNDVLNKSVQIRNVKSTGWIRSDIYLAYVKDVFVSNYETEPDELCIKGVHVFYIASSYKSKLTTENVIVHGRKESNSTGWITGVYQLAGNAINSITNDYTVRMDVYADNSYIENCKVSVLVKNYDGEVVLTNCVFKNNTLEISNMNAITSNIKFIGCNIYSSEVGGHTLVETLDANYASTTITLLNCIIDVLATTMCGGSYTPNLKIIGSVLNIWYTLSHKTIDGILYLENNYIYKNRRGDFISATGTGIVIVKGNHIESNGGDTQFKFENGTLILANNIIKWLDNTPTLCSSNAVQQNNLIV